MIGVLNALLTLHSVTQELSMATVGSRISDCLLLLLAELRAQHR